MTQAEFAARHNVTPGRVSQWINGKGGRPGLLNGPALVNQGGKRLINAREADRQLQLGRNPAQVVGQMRLSLPPAEVAPQEERGGGLTKQPTEEEENQLRFLRARADNEEQKAERGRREELESRGVVVNAQAAAAAWSKQLADFLAAIDPFWRDMAKAIHAAGPMDERALTSFLRKQWREFRADRAKQLREAGMAMPDLVTEVADDAPG